MQVNTTRFGEMDIPDDLIVCMPEGIAGFPEDRRFVLLEESKEMPFHWLQSVDTAELAFIVMDPHAIDPDYRIEFDEDTFSLFGTIVPEEIIPLVVVNIPSNTPDKANANMRAPIIVHSKKRYARQIVLSNEDYSVQEMIFG